MRRACTILGLVGLFGLAAGPPAFADTIGLAGTQDPTGWRGTAASVAITGVSTVTQGNPDGSPVVVENFGKVVSTDPVQVAAYGYAQAAPYALKAAGVSLRPDVTMAATASFSDEIYFSQAAGLWGYLEFEFDVEYCLGVFSDAGVGEFGMELWYDEPGHERQLDGFVVMVDGSVTTQLALGTTVVTLSTKGNDPDSPVLLANARYFPFTFRLWTTLTGTLGGGGLDGVMPLTPAFRGVRAFAASPLAGGFQQLTDPDDYELRSANGYDLKPISEPASLFLLGAGLLGLGAWRTRR